MSNQKPIVQTNRRKPLFKRPFRVVALCNGLWQRAATRVMLDIAKSKKRIEKKNIHLADDVR